LCFTYVQLLPLIAQAVLVGYLSQYFCDKNSLEEELTLLRSINNSELVDQIEEEISIATRDAYLYAAGITLLSCFGAFAFTWTFYTGEKFGTMHRIALVSTIYSKVPYKSLLHVVLVILCRCSHCCNININSLFQSKLLATRTM